MGFSVIDEQSLRHPREPETAPPRRDFVESGMRFYSSTLARWINRDPIGERGGKNLYGFIRNRVENTYDYLGMKETSYDSLEGKFCCNPLGTKRNLIKEEDGLHCIDNIRLGRMRYIHGTFQDVLSAGGSALNWIVDQAVGSFAPGEFGPAIDAPDIFEWGPIPNYGVQDLLGDMIKYQKRTYENLKCDWFHWKKVSEEEENYDPVTLKSGDILEYDAYVTPWKSDEGQWNIQKWPLPWWEGLECPKFSQ